MINRWILTDVANDVWLDEFSTGSDAGIGLPGTETWSVRKRTLRGGLSDGIDVIEVDNGKLAVSLLPTRGMGLWKGSCDGMTLGWDSPVKQSVHPKFVNQTDRGGLGWLAGFNEWLCRCGLDSNGAPGTDVVANNEGNPVETQLTLHGHIANLPAHHVEVAVSTNGEGSLSVTGIIDETMLFGPCLRLKSTFETIGRSNRFTIRDEVTNLGGAPAELELLYHTNLGRPLLEEGSRFVAPIAELAPRDARAAEDISNYAVYQAPTVGYVEQAYFMELVADAEGKTEVLLRNQAGDKGLSLRMDKSQLPCFTLWKNTQAEADGYVTGLEPATNYPNLKTFERKHGRVVTLAPEGVYRVELGFEIVTSPDGVAQAEDRIASLQELRAGHIHEQPQPSLSQ